MCAETVRRRGPKPASPREWGSQAPRGGKAEWRRSLRWLPSGLVVAGGPSGWGWEGDPHAVVTLEFA